MSIDVGSGGEIYAVTFTLRTRTGHSDFGDGSERFDDAEAEYDGPFTIEHYIADHATEPVNAKTMPAQLARDIFEGIDGYVKHAETCLR